MEFYNTRQKSTTLTENQLNKLIILVKKLYISHLSLTVKQIDIPQFDLVVNRHSLTILWAVALMHLYAHLITKAEFSISDPYFFIFTCLGKTFQKRRVSSPDPVTIDSPSGLIAR